MPDPGFARHDLCSIRTASEQDEFAEPVRGGFGVDGHPPAGDDPPASLASDYTRSDMRASFFPFGQGIRNCLGEGFAWAETVLVLSAIAARWDLRLADGASVRLVTSSTLVASELPIIVARRSPARRTQGLLAR